MTPEKPQRPGLGRRVVGIAVDWAACLAITFGLVGQVYEITPVGESFIPLAVLFAEHTLLVGLAGGSLGHRLLGMGVISAREPRVTLLRSAMRAALLCLVVPAVVYDKDGNGLHDLAAGTRIIRV